MRMIEIIEKKKLMQALSKNEIEDLISAYSQDEIPDYQMSSLLMAIRLNGMTADESAFLTEAMRNSGQQIDLSAIDGIKVDKHSTGGVGDTTTLITIPVAAACGVIIAKMSGRSLGHTGGTLDKLESIPGYKIELNYDEFQEIIKKCGCCVMGQSDQWVPADKKLYALRDVTATVDSLPLISSSIMSKKLAAGSNALMLDVKTGSGAFLKSQSEAIALANSMCSIGNHCGVKTAAIISDMNQPLGGAIGNSLEVVEAVQILKQGGQSRLAKVAIELAAGMIYLSKQSKSFEEAKKRAWEALNSGLAFKKLVEMVSLQGGNPAVLHNTQLLMKASVVEKLYSPQAGYVASMQNDQLGKCAMFLGAGRTNKEDQIDPYAGIWMNCQLGDKIEKGALLATFYAKTSEKIKQSKKIFLDSIELSKNRPKIETKLIYQTLGLLGDENDKK